MKVEIVGAGLAGLLAANMLQSHRQVKVFEKQLTLPNNHSAVLRFRTSSIGDVLNIPFKKVTMIKTHSVCNNLVADSLMYSFKNSGVYCSDRSIITGPTTADRYIAPPDLIKILADRIKPPIEFNYDFNFHPGRWPVISTIPMPTLMKKLNYPNIENVTFNFSSGFNVRATIDQCDAYVSLLVPDPSLPFSRISITGNEIIIECPNLSVYVKEKFGLECVSLACTLCGINNNKISTDSIVVKEQRYAKINQIDDDIRKDFIFWATDNFGIFSLGRFATWRPGLLLDDLIKDIRLIDKWMDKKDRYAIARAR